MIVAIRGASKGLGARSILICLHLKRSLIEIKGTTNWLLLSRALLQCFFFPTLTFIKVTVGIFCTLCPVRSRWSKSRKGGDGGRWGVLNWLTSLLVLVDFWLIGTTPQRMNAARSKVSRRLRGSLLWKDEGCCFSSPRGCPGTKMRLALKKKWRFKPSHLTVASLSPVWMRDGGKSTDV